MGPPPPGLRLQWLIDMQIGRWLAALLLARGCAATDGVRLSAGKSVPGFVAAGERSFLVDLREGEAATLRVEQGETDLVLSIYPPGAAAPRVVDGFDMGPESATVIAAGAGQYRLGLRRVSGAAPAKFTVAMVDRREGTAADRERVRAEDLSTEAKRLSRSGQAGAPARALPAGHSRVPTRLCSRSRALRATASS